MMEEEVEFNPIIKELWDEYKKIVKIHGYSADTEQIVFKIYSLTHKE